VCSATVELDLKILGPGIQEKLFDELAMYTAAIQYDKYNAPTMV
jgi:hypothetical protein